MTLDKYDRRPPIGGDEVIHSLDQQSFQALLFNSFLNQQQRKRGTLKSMQRLTGILLLVQELAGCTDYKRVLNEATNKAVEVTGATGAAIALKEAGGMICLASSGATSPELGVPMSAQSGLSGECVRSGRTLVCLDTESDPRVNRMAARSLCARSMVVVPMQQNGSVVGVLEAFAPQAGAFDSEDVVTLEVLANVAVLGIAYCCEMAIRLALESERGDIARVLEEITPALQAAIAEGPPAAASAPAAPAGPELPQASSSSAILAARSLPLTSEELQGLAESLSMFRKWKPQDGNGQPPR
jgi:transcriptional regulator with GAF, ATPase, and Fis domain